MQLQAGIQDKEDGMQTVMSSQLKSLVAPLALWLAEQLQSLGQKLACTGNILEAE